MPYAPLYLSACITRLELAFPVSEPAIATGFFARHAGQWFLVSNWHVFSGRDNITGQSRSRMGEIPRSVTFSFIEEDPFGNLARVVAERNLYNGTDVSWIQHPVHGQDIDIAALPLGDEKWGHVKDFLAEGDDSMVADAGTDVFLPGYPKGIAGPGGFPVWKRGSIATSLHFGLSDPTFLVDTATRDGMSGAPCFALSNNGYFFHPNLHETEVKHNSQAFAWRFLGIYSGRINASDDFEAQLGQVWKSRYLMEVLSGLTPGDFALR